MLLGVEISLESFGVTVGTTMVTLGLMQENTMLWYKLAKFPKVLPR